MPMPWSLSCTTWKLDFELTLNFYYVIKFWYQLFWLLFIVQLMHAKVAWRYLFLSRLIKVCLCIICVSWFKLLSYSRYKWHRDSSFRLIRLQLSTHRRQFRWMHKLYLLQRYHLLRWIWMRLRATSWLQASYSAILPQRRCWPFYVERRPPVFV